MGLDPLLCLPFFPLLSSLCLHFQLVFTREYSTMDLIRPLYGSLLDLSSMECTAFCTPRIHIPTSRKHSCFSLLPHGPRCRLLVPTSSLPSKTKTKTKTVYIPYPQPPFSSPSPWLRSKPSSRFHYSSLLNHARKPFVIMLFSIALSLTPNPHFKQHAIARPSTITSKNDVKSKGGNTSNDHEFSVYTNRLLDCVPNLEKKVKEINEQKGDMSFVKLALKEVRERATEIQKEILGNLGKELKQLGNEEFQCIAGAKLILGKVLQVRKKLGKLVRREKARTRESECEVAIKEKQRILELQKRLEGLEREFNELIGKAADLNKKAEMRKRLTFSVGIREILFLERECGELVQKLEESLKTEGIG